MSVTIKDISEHTGLAISTISKYINGGNVLPENQVKIQKAIEELKFSVNPFARSMKTNKSYIVGIVFTLPNEGFDYWVISMLQRQFMAYGYYCIVESCDNSVESQERITNFLLSKNIDALIFFNMLVRMDSFDLYCEKKIPVLTIGSKPDNEKCDQIIFDDFTVIETVTRFLLSKVDAVAFLGGNQSIRMHRTRYNGFMHGLQTANVTMPEEYVSFGECSSESGYRRMIDLLQLKNRPKAVFISDAHLAVGAYIAAKELDVSIPNELIVTTFQNSALPESCAEGLNSLQLPINRICTVAAKLIMDKLDADQDIFQTIQIPYEVKIIE